MPHVLIKKLLIFQNIRTFLKRINCAGYPAYYHQHAVAKKKQLLIGLLFP